MSELSLAAAIADKIERYEYALRWIASGAADEPNFPHGEIDGSWPMGRRRMKRIAAEALRPRCSCCGGSGHVPAAASSLVTPGEDNA